MPITPLSTDLNYHQALPDQPNATDGLTPSEVKQRYDQAANDIKTYINDTLIVEVDAAVTTGGGNLTTHKSSGDHDSRYYTETEINTQNALLVTKADLTTTRKLSAAGDFTGSWHGIATPSAAEPGIQSQVDANTSGLATLSAETMTGRSNAKTEFGADPTGVADSASAIQAAINKGGAVLPRGTYTAYSMIEVGSGQSLILAEGATIVRPAASDSTDPVVWVKGTNAILKGAGMGLSIIKSEKRAPKGVVRLGHKDMTESHANVNYCTLSDMTISGNTVYGQTTGDPDIALYMPNPQFSGLTSYFHTVANLKLQNANYGLYLHGYANANIISGIQGYQLGNVTSGHKSFLYCHGALDITMSGAFFHSSPNSIGLKVDDCDNTSNGGSVHNVHYNSWAGLVFEQGGANAEGIVASEMVNGGSYYEIRHNTGGGNEYPANFRDRNTFIGNDSIKTQLRTMQKRIGETSVNIPICEEKYIFYNALTEDKTYKVMDIVLVSNRSSIVVSIEFSSRSGSSVNWVGGGTITYLVTKDGSGVYSAQILSHNISTNGAVNPCELITTDGTCIAFRVKNNGTATTTNKLNAVIRTTYSPSTTPQTTLTYYDEATLSLASGTVIRPRYGTTAQRPSSPGMWEMYGDTTIGKPIWWDGTNWIAATVTTV